MTRGLRAPLGANLTGMLFKIDGRIADIERVELGKKLRVVDERWDHGGRRHHDSLCGFGAVAEPPKA